jgi:hypothetical protein
MKVMLQRAEDALFLSLRIFATKSALNGGARALRLRPQLKELRTPEH